MLFLLRCHNDIARTHLSHNSPVRSSSDDSIDDVLVHLPNDGKVHTNSASTNRQENLYVDIGR